MKTTIIRAMNIFFNPIAALRKRGQTSINEGDVLTSKYREKCYIQRFDGDDSTYFINPGIPLTVKTSAIYGYYKDGAFREDLTNGTEHFLIEGRNAFGDNLRGCTTDALYLSEDIIREHLIHQNTQAKTAA